MEKQIACFSWAYIRQHRSRRTPASRPQQKHLRKPSTATVWALSDCHSPHIHQVHEEPIQDHCVNGRMWCSITCCDKVCVSPAQSLPFISAVASGPVWNPDLVEVQCKFDLMYVQHCNVNSLSSGRRQLARYFKITAVLTFSSLFFCIVESLNERHNKLLTVCSNLPSLIQGQGTY